MAPARSAGTRTAIAACRKSAAIVPSVAAYSNWGAVLSNLRRFDEAIEQFAEARRVGPEDYLLDGDMARAYFHAGRRAEAMTLYARAIALVDQALTVDPRDIDARLSAAAYHAKTGNRRQGDRALEQAAVGPVGSARAHLRRGRLRRPRRPGDGAVLARARVARGHGGRRAHDWIELDALKSEPRYAALFGK